MSLEQYTSLVDSIQYDKKKNVVYMDLTLLFKDFEATDVTFGYGFFSNHNSRKHAFEERGQARLFQGGKTLEYHDFPTTNFMKKYLLKIGYTDLFKTTSAIVCRL